MKRIKTIATMTIFLAAVGTASMAALVARSVSANRAPALPVHVRRDVCITKTMWSRTIDQQGLGDWRHHYTDEISYKASGEYASRTTTADGKVSMCVAENGQVACYGADGAAPATSRPFKPAAEFLDENWLAANKCLDIIIFSIIDSLSTSPCLPLSSGTRLMFSEKPPPGMEVTSTTTLRRKSATL